MEEAAASAADDCRRGSLRGGKIEQLVWTQTRCDPPDENSINLNKKDIKVRAPDRTRLLVSPLPGPRFQCFSGLGDRLSSAEAGSEEGAGPRRFSVEHRWRTSSGGPITQ